MYIDFDNADALADEIQKLDLKSSSVIMIFLSDAHLDISDEIVNKLNSLQIIFFGAIFPGVISGKEYYYKGAIVTVLENANTPIVVKLSVDSIDWPKDQYNFEEDSTIGLSGYIFIDCFSPNINALLEAVFSSHPKEVSFFGGGSGNRELSHKPSILCSEGVLKEAVVFCIEKSPSSVSVRHGWQHHMGPFIVSKSDKNIIKEFNWKPAKEVYLEAIPEELRNTSVENFYQNLSSRYPLALQKEGEEDVIRDPVSFDEDGALVCLSEVPENIVMHVVHAKPEELIKAAEKGVADIVHSAPAKQVLISDCYSRALMLDQRFNEEIAAAHKKTQGKNLDVPMEGFLALGEIAKSGHASLEFYNKTFVSCLRHQ
jgi:hypothetical protein